MTTSEAIELCKQLDANGKYKSADKLTNKIIESHYSGENVKKAHYEEEIQRWDLVGGYDLELGPVQDGDYVKYEDHIRIVEEIKNPDNENHDMPDEPGFYVDGIYYGPEN
jgi:hypothetical protein